MKRQVSMVLAISMVGSLWSAQAAVSQDKQLEAVTNAVKSRLGIGSSYTEFYGELEDDGLKPYWSLQWSMPGQSLSVQAAQDGTIYRYYSSKEEPNGGSYDPSLPKNDRETAQRAAQAFAEKTLGKEETIVFEEMRGTVQPLTTSSYSFYGRVLLGGLPTPATFGLRIHANDLSIEYFARDEGNVASIAAIVAPKATKEAAAALLKDKLHLRLQYTTQTSDGSAAKEAQLYYVPERTDEYYIDAQSGEAINLTELRSALARNESVADSGAATGGSSASKENLSAAEQTGVDKLKDVLAKEAIDRKLRSMTQLGLNELNLANASYSVDRTTSEVSAFLQYTSGDNRDARVQKYLTVNAKSGELLSMRSYYSADNAGDTDASDASAAKADAFLKQYQAQDYAKTARYLQAEGDMLLFERQENGYPFPENYFRIGINKKLGTIDSYTKVWSPKISFQDVNSVINEEKVLDVYFNTFTVDYGYVAVPIKLDSASAQFADYIAKGYSYVDTWKLGYCVQAKKDCYAVDAQTGEAQIRTGRGNESAVQYSDAAESQYPQAARLAKYGIGYPGGMLQPQAALSQESMLALLMSASGYIYVPEEENAQERLYENAYRLGLLTREEFAPEKAMSRAELVKTIVKSTGYGKAAELSGIYRCSFADESSIPTQYYGYVAIAQGMGLVNGDDKGRFEPNRTATRNEAAIMLYHFMSR